MNFNEKKTRRKINDEMRLLITQHSERGLSLKQISNNLNSPRTTISSVLHVYQKYGRTGGCRKRRDFSTKHSKKKKLNWFLGLTMTLP